MREALLIGSWRTQVGRSGSGKVYHSGPPQPFARWPRRASPHAQCRTQRTEELHTCHAAQERLAAASAYGDDADIDWIAAVWAPGMTLAKLQYVESRFISLSRKLSIELYKTCPKRVTMVIDEYNRQLAVKGAILNGPQVLFLMLLAS